MKSHITVVGAAIIKDGKLLALRRSDGNDEVIHKFEFVGGKVEEGETPQEALIRECREELSLEIEVGDLLNTFEYDYPNTSVSLSVYFVKPVSDYKLSVHEEERWMECSSLDSAEWAPADKKFLSTIKKGYTKIVKAETMQGFEIIHSIADEVLHESFDKTLTPGQVDYIVGKFLTPEAIKEHVTEKKYTFKLIFLNGEAVGFYSYCPAKYYNENFTEGTYLSRMYLKKFARGKKITSKIFSSLARPVYLTVKRDNVQGVNLFKHGGFKILQSVKTDIGDGYVMDDFLMILGK